MRTVQEFSIKTLNEYLARQVPAELPPGLVTVSGRVGSASDDLTFSIVDRTHQLPFRLIRRARGPRIPRSGDGIKVTGYAVFDRRQARYILLVRDLVFNDKRPASVVEGYTAPELPELPEPASLEPDLLDPYDRELREAELFALMSAALDSQNNEELTPEMLGGFDEPASVALAQPVEIPSAVVTAAAAQPTPILSLPSTPAPTQPEEDVPLAPEPDVPPLAGAANAQPATESPTAAQEEPLTASSPSPAWVRQGTPDVVAAIRAKEGGDNSRETMIFSLAVGIFLIIILGVFMFSLLQLS